MEGEAWGAPPGGWGSAAAQLLSCVHARGRVYMCVRLSMCMRAYLCVRIYVHVCFHM